MLDSHDFTFLIEDPATVWNLGPQRYPEIAKRYQPLTPHTNKLAIDINIVDRYQDVYPTKQQTGTELFELVHLASTAFPRVALYFENSILAPDLPLLPAAGAIVPHAERTAANLIIDSPYGVGVVGQAKPKSMAIPGPSPTVPLSGFLPVLTPSNQPPKLPAPHIADFNGDLHSADRTGKSTIDLSYESASRAFALLDHKPTKIEIDAAPFPLTFLATDKGTYSIPSPAASTWSPSKRNS